jgi:WD40 repeat protein
MSPSRSISEEQSVKRSNSNLTLSTSANSRLHFPRGKGVSKNELVSSEISFSSNASSKNERDRSDLHLSSQLFAFLPESKLIFSCGHWDYSFKVTMADTGKILQSISVHSEVVTCLAIAQDVGLNFIVTGSGDCCCMVWELYPNSACPISHQPLHVLGGHDDAVTSLAVSAVLDIVVSGSVDGTIIIHSLREGLYVRSIEFTSSLMSAISSNTMTTVDVMSTSDIAESGPSKKLGVAMLSVSEEGYVVAYYTDGSSNMLCSYTVNGRCLSTIDPEERLYSMIMSEDGRVLLTGGERCLVVMRWVISLTLADDGPRQKQGAILDGYEEDGTVDAFTSPIRSIYLTHEERLLVVGLESGEMRIFAQVDCVNFSLNE